MKIAGVALVLTCSAIACGELAATQGSTDDGGDDASSQESGTDSDGGATTGFTTGIASETSTGFTNGLTNGIVNGTDEVTTGVMTGITTVIITTGSATGITTLGTGPTTGTTTFTSGTATGTTFTTGTATGTTTGTVTATTSSTGVVTGVSNGTTTLTCSGNTCCGKSSLPAALGDAELTCYTFAQGPQSNTTFCGYRESETAYSDSDAGGACVTGGLAYNDTVANVGTNPGYFVAFPSNDLGWGQGAYCGMCVDVTYGGRTLMATVVDQCTTCGNSPDHIALSANLARDLGVGVGSVSGDVLGATWTTVACPVASNNGNIVVAWDSTGRASFQNVTYPVASVAGTLQTGGAWIVDAGASVTLTDLVGHQITAVMPTTDGGSLGTQFPASCP